MIKINLFSGPGSGKSTVSAILYGMLKAKGYNCELVREYAKDLVYMGIDLTKSTKKMQYKIFNEQVAREQLLIKGNVPIIITDSPLLLNAYYSNNELVLKKAKKFITENDLNIWIHRIEDVSFESHGRSHTQTQSFEIDQNLKKFLKERYGVDCIELFGNSKDKAKAIFKLIKGKI